MTDSNIKTAGLLLQLIMYFTALYYNLSLMAVIDYDFIIISLFYVGI